MNPRTPPLSNHIPSPDRIPPGQQLAAPGKWPFVGERSPGEPPAVWTVQAGGLVRFPRIWTLDELLARPRRDSRMDIHCVTRWSILDANWQGIPLADLLREASPLPAAQFVRFIANSPRRHDTSLPLDEVLALDPLVAFTCDGAPLSIEHGGPVRLIVPNKYFYKSLKWLATIELLADDRLGYWEATAGYHNGADPWREQRYLAPDLDRREASRLLAERDLRERPLRSLDATGRELAGLRAAGALLRDADFSRCSIRDADFSRANLSNARLTDADARGATFRDADVEGADFRGADLRGADFRGASLLGVTFVDENGSTHAARGDATTRFDLERTADLAPAQAAWVRGLALDASEPSRAPDTNIGGANAGGANA